MVKRLIILCILLIASISCAATLIQFKRGTEATLPSTGSAGEPLFTTDSKRFFIGTGSGREEYLRAIRYTNLSTEHNRTRSAYRRYSTLLSARVATKQPTFNNSTTLSKLGTYGNDLKFGNSVISTRTDSSVVWVGNSNPSDISATGVNGDYYWYASGSAMYQKSNGAYTLVGSLPISVPSTSTSTCVKGQISSSSTYIYSCYSTNKWTRSSSATW